MKKVKAFSIIFMILILLVGGAAIWYVLLPARTFDVPAVSLEGVEVQPSAGSWHTRLLRQPEWLADRIPVTKETASPSGAYADLGAIGKKQLELEVPAEADRFYFFNPFSEKILHSVVGRIIASWYKEPRRILLMYYYPSDEYVGYLLGVDELSFLDEIDCSDLFPDDPRERILCFETL